MTTPDDLYKYYTQPPQQFVRSREQPVSKKPELTVFGHVGHALFFALCIFTVIGGVIGAVIGDIQAWEHLHWVFATAITIGVISLAFGIIMHVLDRTSD